MKAPVGLLSDRTVLRSKMEGPCPDKFQLLHSLFLFLVKTDTGASADVRYPVLSIILLFIYGCAQGGDGGRSNSRRRYRTNRPRCA